MYTIKGGSLLREGNSVITCVSRSHEKTVLSGSLSQKGKGLPKMLSHDVAHPGYSGTNSSLSK